MPATDESLHAWIKAVLGFHIPRVSVTEGHAAPFDFVADMFFRRTQRALVLGGRGTGKTQSLAILNLLMSKFSHGLGTTHYGAVGSQGNWGHDYLKLMVKPQYLYKDIQRNVGGILEWRNGSWVRSMSGYSLTGVTAVRAQRIIQDEVDLWDMVNYETAQFMVTGTKRHPAQRIAASTAYNAFGLMSVLLKQAKRRSMKVYKYGVFESLEQCRECRYEKCPFFVWTNPRTGNLEPLCKGRGLRSDGFVPLEAAIDEFYSTDRETWAVQKLLYAPERRSLIYPTMSQETHCGKPPMKEILAYAEIGIGVDWGFDHPLCFIVVAQLPNGQYWVLEEIGERFATPQRELEIAEELATKWTQKTNRRLDITFYCGQDQPKSIAALNIAGHIAVGNMVKSREEGHREIRRLLNVTPRGPLLMFDDENCPATFAQMSTLHKGEKGKEVLKDNDFADGGRYVLGSASAMGGLQAGGVLML